MVTHAPFRIKNQGSRETLLSSIFYRGDSTPLDSNSTRLVEQYHGRYRMVLRPTDRSIHPLLDIVLLETHRGSRAAHHPATTTAK